VSTSFLKLDAPKAVRAVRALLADPDDLPQVFTLLEAISGDTLARMEKRLGASDAGRRILATRPEIVSKLEDREALRSLPKNSLGRTYLDFVESEGISAMGIRKADEVGHSDAWELPPVEAYLHQRMRDTHDLWHAVTGYKGDVLGEVALLAFTLAQTWNQGIALLVAVGIYKTLGAEDGAASRALIVEGFRRGRRAAWLPEQEWEGMLEMPVDEVRAKLGVGAPPVYVPVRSAELKAAA
jgi:ubiquinone biosynthesis protein COQ4